MTEQSGQGQTLDNLLTESRTFPPPACDWNSMLKRFSIVGQKKK